MGWLLERWVVWLWVTLCALFKNGCVCSHCWILHGSGADCRSARRRTTVHLCAMPAPTRRPPPAALVFARVSRPAHRLPQTLHHADGAAKDQRGVKSPKFFSSSGQCHRAKHQFQAEGRDGKFTAPRSGAEREWHTDQRGGRQATFRQINQSINGLQQSLIDSFSAAWYFTLQCRRRRLPDSLVW